MPRESVVDDLANWFSTQSELPDGLTASFTYDRDELASVQVNVMDGYGEPGMKSIIDSLNNGEGRQALMSRISYRRWLRAIAQVKSIGTFVRRESLASIPTSGWIRRSENYSRARIVRLERNCVNPHPKLGCGIRRFTVFYWVPLEGRVNAKHEKKSEFIGPELTQYFVTVDDREVEISKADYERLQTGQIIRLERTLDSTLARRIVIKRARK